MDSCEGDGTRVAAGRRRFWFALADHGAEHRADAERIPISLRRAVAQRVVVAEPRALGVADAEPAAGRPDPARGDVRAASGARRSHRRDGDRQATPGHPGGQRRPGGVRVHTSTGTGRPYVDPDGKDQVADTPNGHFTFTRQVDGWRDGDLGLMWRPKYFHPTGVPVWVYGEAFGTTGAEQ